MSFIFRSTLRATVSRSIQPAIAPLAPFNRNLMRYNSSLPPSSSPSSSSSSHAQPSTPPSIPGLDSLRFADHIPSPRSDPGLEESEVWWAERSRKNAAGFPTTTWTGRSVLVPKGGEYQSSYRRLQGLLRNSNLKTELRIGEFHEKPSVRRRRLLSERHRRRFKEMVRNKVQQVMSMRNRG